MQTSSVLPCAWERGRKRIRRARVSPIVAATLRNALKQIERKVEFDVEAAWNGGEIFKLIENRTSRSASSRNAFAAGSPWGPTNNWPPE